jgi:uncharacterized membrane protein
MELRIDLAPNCSLSRSGAKLFFISTCLFSLTFSLFFAVQGLWPVLVFWGLEMALFGIALRLSMRRARETQTVLITDSRICLVTRSQRGEAKQEFARHWAKVRLRCSRLPRHPSRLMIESSGRAFEIGSFLTEEERCRLAERLSNMVGGINESPPLESD